MSARDDESRSGFLDKRMTRREVLKGATVASAVVALGPLLAACGSDTTSSAASASASAAPKTGGNLRVATSAGSAKEELDIQYPAFTIPSLDARLNMYDSLLEFGPTGVLGTALAQEVTPNSAATQFTVRLKPDLVFHNGKAVTADDVVYSFNRILNPKNPGLAAKQLSGLASGGCKKVDKLTVRFELTTANAVFPQALAAYSTGIVPVGYDPKGATGAIGTGPFKITNFIPGQQIVLAKNPDYWRQGGGPYVDTVTLIEFADSTAQLNALLGRAVDYCNALASTQPKIASSNGFELLTARTGSWEPFTMRADVKPFSDVRVRQAFRLIVDRQQIIAQARGGMASVGNDMYGLYDPGYPKGLPQREQDLDKARSLLKAAGYDNDLAVTLTTSSGVASTAPTDATVFAQQAKDAGVTVNIKNVTGDSFWGSEYLKYVLSQDNWGARGYLVQAAMGTMPGSLYDETHWTNAKWLALIKEAYRTVDDTRRNELITEAATIEYNEGGYIIHSFDDQIDAHAKNVKGAVPDFSGLGLSASNVRYRTVYFA
jgi:peptide/nickel transport system substrate-binding protein